MEHHIEVVEHDPAWADAYGHAAARIGRALGDRLERIEHIGSTAVPGLEAKPVVDVRAMVDVDAALEDCVAAVEDATRFAYGFNMRHWKLLRREVSEAPAGERWPEDGDAVRAYNLHLTHIDGDEWRTNVVLRDYLRDHPEARERYAAVKREAAREYPDDIEAYSEAKDDVIADLLERARAADYAVVE